MVGWKKILRHRSQSQQCQNGRNTVADFDDSDLLFVATMNESPSASAADTLNDVSDTGNNLVTLPEEIRDYYYPNLDKDSATEVLQRKPIGTFLLRPSQWSSAVYTLSVRSEKHVFNVRIFKKLEGDGDNYHLDAPKHLRKLFPSVAALLRYYSQSPRELIALCTVDNIDERATFKLIYPLSKSENALNLLNPNPGMDDRENSSRPVTRQVNGGSLKAMVKWL